MTVPLRKMGGNDDEGKGGAAAAFARHHAATAHEALDHEARGEERALGLVPRRSVGLEWLMFLLLLLRTCA